MEGRDVIGRSSTGTGKTAAFGIPMLQLCAQKQLPKSSVLILSTTRELSMQIADEMRKFGKYLQGVSMATVYGGAPMEGQIRQLRTANIVIGTPGRIMDHMRRRTLRLDNLQTIVLDEADEMLNMGFYEDIQTILSEAPEQRQTILFSATMPPQIMKITQEFQTNPEIVAVDGGRKTVDNISQYYYSIPQSSKNDTVKLLLAYHRPKRALVFCNTKKMVDELTALLNDSGFRAVGLHGDLKQSQRTTVMKEFKNGRTNVLIATDVAARGIDVDDVEAVINYDIPQEVEYYIHRIGRTGRAGRQGASYTLAANRNQMYRIREIERYMGAKIEEQPVPTLESIAQKNSDKMLLDIKQRVDENAGYEYRKEIEQLVKDGYDAVDVAAALYARVAGNDKRLAAVKNIRSMENSKKNSFSSALKDGKVWVKVDIGSDDKIGPNFIVGAIVEATGLTSRSIGKINIFSDYTDIEMTAEDAQLVIQAMGSSSKIKGRTVHYSMAKETRQQAQNRRSTQKRDMGAPHRKRKADSRDVNPAAGRVPRKFDKVKRNHTK
ncbi:MAG: DEAD/DEAH box helicase, partial [Oscillospiraceae bacterium]|nr:DEAD/DEAH box helicase [Oscillospiraceae bacterium]